MVDNLKLKNRVKELCTDSRFKHHKWFFEHHLLVIERLVDELKPHYPDADFEVIESLVWFHDLEKITKNQEVTPEKVLLDIGFSSTEIDKLVELNKIEEKHREIDINMAPLEVKILSSVDGAAHLIGPFYSIYWYENPDKTIESLTQGDLEKLKRDWERKVVIREVREAFLKRFEFMLEQRGVYPQRFIN